MSSTQDAVSLTLPGGDRWAPVAELVLAGLGARLDLPYDRIDELQLAVTSILRAATGDVRVEARIDPGTLEVEAGPLAAAVVDDAARRRVLEALADGVSVGDGEDGARLVLTFVRGGTG